MERILKPAIWVGIALMLSVPIYANSNYFFPFIYSKALVLRLGVELLLLALVILVGWGKERKLQFDKLITIFFVYLLLIFVSSWLGGNFYFSFWSYIERSEGLLMWIHLFGLLIILRNLLNSEKQWLIFFDIFFGVAQIVALIGLLQYGNVDFINAPGLGEERVASTIGNAAFLAGYLLFAFWIGLFLACRRGRPWLYYYLPAVLLDVFVMFQTGTRGAMLGLLGGLALFGLYNVVRSPVRRVRLGGSLLIALLAVFLAAVFFFKDSPWVSNNLGLHRLTSISLTDTTAQARLQTWESAGKGWVKKPLLGYGQENFYLVFNQYFNPLIYRHENSRLWYDRAHNIFIDHLVTGGILGLALYLALFALPLVWLWRAQLRRRRELGYVDRQQLAEQMIILALVSFLIQGIFVFESIVVYLALILIWAYIGWKYDTKPLWQLGASGSRIIALLLLVALIPAMYFFNIKETRANRLVVEGLRLQGYAPEQAIAKYELAIDLGTSGTQEYRRRLAEYVSGLLVSQKYPVSNLKMYVQRVDQELELRLVENPQDTANYLLFMRFLNTSYILDPNRLFRVEELGRKALELSPTRPQLYYELGYAQYYLAEWYELTSKAEERKAALAAMRDYFQKGIDLNPDVRESYINMVMVLLATGQSEQATQFIDQMDDRGMDYTIAQHLNRIVNSAVQAGDFAWLRDFYLKLNSHDPSNADYIIGIALSYANLKEFDKAIEYAAKARVLGGVYGQQSEKFINCIKNKTYTFDPTFSCK